MNFNQFMRKVDGREPQHEPTNSTTPEAWTLNVQSILRIARGYGYAFNGLEERPEFPTGIVELFLGQQPGYFEVGLHEYDSFPWEYYQCLHSVLESGHRYSHSQQQEELPVEPRESQERYSQGTAPISNDAWSYVSYRDYRYTVGSATRDTQSRSEPNSDELFRTAIETLRRLHHLGLVRPASRREEGGVSGVRNEWTGGEYLSEDTGESE